MTSATLYSN